MTFFFRENKQRENNHGIQDPPDSPRLAGESPEPFDAAFLHPLWCSSPLPCEKIERSAHSHGDFNAWQLCEIACNPKILRRGAKCNKEECWGEGIDAANNFFFIRFTRRSTPYTDFFD